VTEKDPEVIHIDNEKDSKTIIIPVVLTAVVVLLIAVCVRQAMSKTKAE
jgi:cell division protein FtsB